LRMDNLSERARSFCMSRIRSADTGPERLVRHMLHALGYRFRLHRRDLPGCPDIVLPGFRKAIFVHGCFWHTHRCRFGRVTPRTNGPYWARKRTQTMRRDRVNLRRLRQNGWSVLVIWECWTKDGPSLERRVRGFIGCQRKLGASAPRGHGA
jgi:DNA mismatch endonuclease (patch repair protein)